ncbi:MAG: ABC transporter ATP-binding protein [bacterium]|nr:ABC transporter ATP-binding protein [bacterium]
MVDVVDLRKTFRDFWGRPTTEAVKGVSFHINLGEVFGLLGPNGSGKSTTIRMILGLLKADAGSISIFGERPGTPAVHAKIGYLPEITHLHPFLTPTETLTYYGQLFGLSSTTLRKRITDLLALVGLTEVAHHRVGTFSKGMARRVGLAQALINAPTLLILDEPTSGLDPIGTREVKDLILELRKRGLSVLMSSHLLPDVQECSDRVLILNHGEALAQGKVSEIEGSLETFFLRAVCPSGPTLPLAKADDLKWVGGQ